LTRPRIAQQRLACSLVLSNLLYSLQPVALAVPLPTSFRPRDTTSLISRDSHLLSERFPFAIFPRFEPPPPLPRRLPLSQLDGAFDLPRSRIARTPRLLLPTQSVSGFFSPLYLGFGPHSAEARRFSPAPIGLGLLPGPSKQPVCPSDMFFPCSATPSYRMLKVLSFSLDSPRAAPFLDGRLFLRTR